MTGSHSCRGSKKTFSKTEASEAASRTLCRPLGLLAARAKQADFSQASCWKHESREKLKATLAFRACRFEHERSGLTVTRIARKLWQLSIKLHHQQTSSAPAASYVKKLYRSLF